VKKNFNVDEFLKIRHSGEPRIEVRGRNRTEFRTFETIDAYWITAFAGMTKLLVLCSYATISEPVRL
jgi:hypothetical protein